VSPGDSIDGKYQILRQLGVGGMGAVYEARHGGTGRRVAVKVILGDDLKKDQAMVARFEREARAAGAVESRHIAQVLDTGVDAKTGHPYLVMEFLAGTDLAQTIQRTGPIRPDVALRIVGQACLGLQKAHEAGVVHRDVKPANIFLTTQDGGEVMVKLLDFGIAKVKMEQMVSIEQASLTATGAMLGSPLYMSPEQARGAKDVDSRTDLWSLGIVLYEALSGTTPYSHCTTLGSLFIAINNETPRPVQELSPWVPPEVAAIVHRAVAHDQAGRFQTAAEMLAAIRAVLPQGLTIDESALVALGPDVRAVSAPRLDLPASGPNPARPGSSSPSGPVPASTGSGLATSNAQAAPSRPAWPVAAAAVLVLAAGGYGVLRASSHKEVAATETGDKAPPPATSTAPPAAPAASPEAPAPAPIAPPAAAITVQLAVAPAGASVEVDGAPSTVTGGRVSLTGPAGSLHHVRVFVGKKEALADVVIEADGPVPPRVALGAAAPPAGKPVAAAAPGPAPAPQPPSAPPAPSPAKAASPPGVDRDFR
jgi:serine/threonine-protein kinase